MSHNLISSAAGFSLGLAVIFYSFAAVSLFRRRLYLALGSLSLTLFLTLIGCLIQA